MVAQRTFTFMEEPRKLPERLINDEILDVEGISELTKYPTWTVRKMLRKGELPGVQRGRQWRALKSEILNVYRTLPPA